MDNSFTLKPGTVLHSHKRDYAVLKVLGIGGFGITYLVEGSFVVENIPTKGYFAVKEHFISSLCERDEETHKVTYSGPVGETVTRSMKAFVKEATRLQSLGIKHRNIVRVNEVFEANNTAYYVMEYLEGETLREAIHAHGALGFNETLKLMRPIVDAVATLHQNNLTHYDIKPGNIILTRDAEGRLRPVLIDFGLSKHYDETGCDTSTLNAKGYSPGYSPIEQYAGLHEFTPQADVYALAATFYFCLTGESPEVAQKFNADNIDARLGALVPNWFVAVMKRAMHYGAKTRTPSALALYRQIYEKGDTKLIPTPKAEKKKKTVRPRVAPKTKKRRNVSWLVALLITIILILGGYYFLHNAKINQQTTTVPKEPQEEKPKDDTPGDERTPNEVQETETENIDEEVIVVKVEPPTKEIKPIETETPKQKNDPRKTPAPVEDKPKVTTQPTSEVDKEKREKEAEERAAKDVQNEIANAFGTSDRKPSTAGTGDAYVDNRGHANSAKASYHNPNGANGTVGGGWKFPSYSKNIRSNEEGVVTFDVEVRKDGSVGRFIRVKNNGLSESTIMNCKNEIIRHRFTHSNPAEAKPATASITFTFKE